MSPARVCSFCVMDETDPQIVFDKKGECNHCLRWRENSRKIMRPYKEFEDIVRKIQASRPGYNCLLGISGGLDSTYTAYVAHQAGLKAYLVHLDNGFDTPQARHNLEDIREATDWEMITVHVDGPEYRDIQKSTLKAGVPNMEAVTDHAISALVFKTAMGHGFRYILSGSNWATEGILPRAWGSDNRDLRNIEAIHRAHGTAPIDRFYRLGLFHRVLLERLRFKVVTPLNYVEYDTHQALKTLTREWGFQEYGDKHGENSLTRFFQKVILPQRWGVDKRRAHLSSRICNGEITREEALAVLETPPGIYADYELDLVFFLEKFNIDEAQLNEYLEAPKHYASEYPNDARIIDQLREWRARARRWLR